MTALYGYGVPTNPPAPKTAEEMIEYFKTRIYQYAAPSKVYIVLYHGKQIRLYNGKHTWSSAGRARAAITNYLYRLTSWNDRKTLQDPKIYEWQENSFKVVSLAEYEETMRKLRNV